MLQLFNQGSELNQCRYRTGVETDLKGHQNSEVLRGALVLLPESSHSFTLEHSWHRQGLSTAVSTEEKPATESQGL